MSAEADAGPGLELATKQGSDREWVRLRSVDAAAKELIAAWRGSPDSIEDEVNALAEAVWPEETE